MKKHFLSLLLLLLSSTSIWAQGWVPAGARSMSMANASVGMYDVWSYHNNPAALGKLETIHAGISYENRFLLKELQSQGIAVAIPLKLGVLSIGGHTYGYSEFRSTKAGVGYSLPLAERLYAGVQMNYQGIQLSQNYGSANTVTGEAGVYGEIKENWTFGFAVFNLGRTRLSEFQDDRLSTVMRFGSAYSFSKKVTVAGEFEKSVEDPLRFKAGAEYQVIEHFYLRGGIGTAPIEVTFGTGYDFGAIQLDLGTAYHQILGWSPHFSLTYHAKAK